MGRLPDNLLHIIRVNAVLRNGMTAIPPPSAAP